MPAFLRKYQLGIGSPERTYAVTRYRTDPQSLSDQIQNPFGVSHGFNATEVENQAGYTDYRTIPAGDQALVIQELHIEAEIEYSSKPEDIKASVCKLRVFNLSPTSRDFIKKDGIVFLKAGYEIDNSFEEIDQERDEQQQRVKASNLPLLFCGQIEHVWVEKKGKDVITEIVCKDLGYVGRNVKVNTSYPRGTVYAEIIQDLLDIAAQNGIPTGFYIKPDSAINMFSPLVRGMSIEGNLLDVIAEVCASVGMQAYISAGQIYVEPKGVQSRIEVVVLHPENIKTCQKEEDTSGESVPSKQVIEGIKVVTFLNGSVTANKMLKIADGSVYAGIYKIQAVRHNLSFEGAQWDTEITATKISR